MMSPRSLLFSSDEETLRRMAQAFAELEFEVESCPDIFSALEKVTSKSFDIILADLDQGPEAGFLLKTAHELKLNQGAFAFAVATGTAYANPQEFGVELVLAKPIVPNQVKYALLSCDGFLAGMRSWSLRADSAAKRAATSPVAAKASWPARSQNPPPPKMLSVRPAEPSPTLNQGLSKKPAPPNVAPAAPSPGSARPAMPATPPSPIRSAAVKPKTRSSQGRVLWSAALGVSSLALGYGASRHLPILKFVSSATVQCRKVLGQVYDQTSRIAQGRSGGEEETETVNPEAAGAETAPSRLKPRTVALSPPLTPVRRSIPPQRGPSPLAETLQAKADAAPQLLPVAARTVQIPDSIRLAQAETESVRTVLGQLEPISLPEDTADQLLAQKVQPNYPDQALRAGLQGAVVLQAWIGVDGNVRDLKLVRGSLLLGQAAYKAVKQWRYKPYFLNGKAVEAQTYVTVNFRLPQQTLLLPATH